jgi:hypothetical protein
MRPASRRTIVAGFNALGDGFNPAEFMEADPVFQSRYAALEGAFMSLSTAAVHAEASALGVEGLPEMASLPGPSFALDTCTEAFLAMDNKVALSGRTNLLVGGMLHFASFAATFTTSGAAGMVTAWRDGIREGAKGAESTYARPDNKNLALWDVACCLAAENVSSGDGSGSDYLAMCAESYLNTANCARSMGRLLQPVVASMDEAAAQLSSSPAFVVVAIQEFPQVTTLLFLFLSLSLFPSFPLSLFLSFSLLTLPRLCLPA